MPSAPSSSERLAIIEGTAAHLLDLSPEPPVCCRLLRDVLRRPPRRSWIIGGQKDSLLVLGGKYQLILLGSVPRTLPPALERTFLQWLWSRPEGIGYLSALLGRMPVGASPNLVDRWLASLELLARGFPTWIAHATEAIDWLWQQRDEDGCWDLGPRPRSLANLPLSSNWRPRRIRRWDWTTRVLALLRRTLD
jgi:hypothetical protein